MLAELTGEGPWERIGEMWEKEKKNKVLEVSNWRELESACGGCQ